MKRSIEKKIPMFVAGGIITAEDKEHFLKLGADWHSGRYTALLPRKSATQARPTEMFIRAREEDLVIIDSPVGMPARAIRNPFVKRMMREKEEICFCYNSLKACDPSTARYCICQALINAVTGDTENGLIFASEKVGQIRKIQTVEQVMEDLQV